MRIDKRTEISIYVVVICWLVIYIINYADVVSFYIKPHSLLLANVTLNGEAIWIHSGTNPYMGSILTLDPNDDLDIKGFYRMGVYYYWFRLNNYEEWTFSLRWWLILSVIAPTVAIIYNIRRYRTKGRGLEKDRGRKILNNTTNQNQTPSHDE